MAILVDPIVEYSAEATRGLPGKSWCHCVSDTSAEELHAFAARIGCRRSWAQAGPAHYDLTPSRRARAVNLGALEVASRELALRNYGGLAKSGRSPALAAALAELPPLNPTAPAPAPRSTMSNPDDVTETTCGGLLIQEAPRGRAIFSLDRRYRYSLDRWLGETAVEESDATARAVFLMLNPSDATAFKNDPTVTSCIKRVQGWGQRGVIGDGVRALRVVNLFALRTPYPDDLRAAVPAERGGDATNDQHILSACRGAAIVIAAWGNHGELGDRARNVIAMVQANGIRLHALKLTGSGAPSHPHARGTSRIPEDADPVAWR